MDANSPSEITQPVGNNGTILNGKSNGGIVTSNGSHVNEGYEPVKTNGRGDMTQLSELKNGNSHADGTEIEETNTGVQEIMKRLKGDLNYAIDERPSWGETLVLGAQHFLLMFSGVLSIPLILKDGLCVNDPVALTELIGTIFFVSGMVTFLQSTFGVRLPIVQGGSFTFIVPTFAILGLRGSCPYGPVTANSTEEERANVTEEWQSRMREIQGAVIASSVFQVVVGFTGIIGVILRFIGPLTIAPTIGLIGISLFEVAQKQMSSQFAIAFLMIFLITLFSQVLSRYSIPLPGKRKFPVFTLFPIILSILIGWVLCGILTVADVFPDDPNSQGYLARTDVNQDALTNSAWFRFPYPFQWGLPVFSLAGILGMLAGTFASMIESVGDYYACARLSGAPPPPPHAINRGIGMEGLGCILAGFWGTGNGTTSYSENIGAIGLTKVGSRVVIQVCAAMLMLVGVFGKLNAVFATIPQPVIGGVLAVTFGMVAAVGVSNLQFVNLNSSRNLFIIGLSFFVGIAIPPYIHSDQNKFSTGSADLDNVLYVLLETSMFIGGLTGFLLDNILAGTPEERGLIKWREVYGCDDQSESGYTVMPEALKCYDFPIGMEFIRRWKWTRFVPFCPTFRGFNLINVIRRRSKDAEEAR